MSNKKKFLTASLVILIVCLVIGGLSINSLIVAIPVALFLALMMKPFYENKIKIVPKAGSNVIQTKNKELTKTQTVGYGVASLGIGAGIFLLIIVAGVFIMFASIGVGSLMK